MASYHWHRLLLNLIRLGTIAAVDHAHAQCRVVTGELITDWLPWTTASAGAIRTWQPPTVGEQVLLLCPSGELAAGVVIRGLYAEAARAPSDQPTLHLIHYPDGAVLQYDHDAHTLVAQLPRGGMIHLNAPQSITLHSPALTLNAQEIHCTGNVTVAGTLSYAGGLYGQGDADAQIDGNLYTRGDITAQGISLAQHRHSGVQAGGDVSGEPQ